MRTDPLKWKALTGDRLNALVAEHVMGLVPGGAYPDYCGDWNRIRDIAEKLRAECFELRTNMCLGGYGATFRADWETGAITPIRATHYDDDLAVAVCRAALDVKGYTP